MTSQQPSPRYVTPGIETHQYVECESGEVIENKISPPPGRYVGLDWIRCTGPQGLEIEVEATLDGWAPTAPKETRGAAWFQRGRLWEPGIQLSLGHSAGILQVDVRGSHLRLLDGDARVDLLRCLVDMGLRPTRLDGAIDYIGQDVAICDQAHAGCDAGELCGPRRFSPRHAFTSDGAPLQKLLALGARDSPLCVRIYDKGLEQGGMPPGYWERIETEFKGDKANGLAARLLSGEKLWSDVLFDYVLGAFDFKVVNGRSELVRRPRSDWWAQLIGTGPAVRIASAQQEQSFAKWHHWFRIAVGPRLIEIAQAVGMPVGALAEHLIDGVESGDSGGAVLHGALRQLGGAAG